MVQLNEFVIGLMVFTLLQAINYKLQGRFKESLKSFQKAEEIIDNLKIRDTCNASLLKAINMVYYQQMVFLYEREFYQEALQTGEKCLQSLLLEIKVREEVCAKGVATEQDQTKLRDCYITLAFVFSNISRCSELQEDYDKAYECAKFAVYLAKGHFFHEELLLLFQYKKEFVKQKYSKYLQEVQIIRKVLINIQNQLIQKNQMKQHNTEHKQFQKHQEMQKLASMTQIELNQCISPLHQKVDKEVISGDDAENAMAKLFNHKMYLKFKNIQSGVDTRSQQKSNERLDNVVIDHNLLQVIDSQLGSKIKQFGHQQLQQSEQLQQFQSQKILKSLDDSSASVSQIETASRKTGLEQVLSSKYDNKFISFQSGGSGRGSQYKTPNAQLYYSKRSQHRRNQTAFEVDYQQKNNINQISPKDTLKNRSVQISLIKTQPKAHATSQMSEQLQAYKPGLITSDRYFRDFVPYVHANANSNYKSITNMRIPMPSKPSLDKLEVHSTRNTVDAASELNNNIFTDNASATHKSSGSQQQFLKRLTEQNRFRGYSIASNKKQSEKNKNHNQISQCNQYPNMDQHICAMINQQVESKYDTKGFEQAYEAFLYQVKEEDFDKDEFNFAKKMLRFKSQKANGEQTNSSNNKNVLTTTAQSESPDKTADQTQFSQLKALREEAKRMTSRIMSEAIQDREMRQKEQKQKEELMRQLLLKSVYQQEGDNSILKANFLTKKMSTYNGKELDSPTSPSRPRTIKRGQTQFLRAIMRKKTHKIIEQPNLVLSPVQIKEEVNMKIQQLMNTYLSDNINFNKSEVQKANQGSNETESSTFRSNNSCRKIASPLSLNLSALYPDLVKSTPKATNFILTLKQLIAKEKTTVDN